MLIFKKVAPGFVINRGVFLQLVLVLNIYRNLGELNFVK